MRESVNGDLYTYFSDFHYVPLPQGICVQSTALVTIRNAPLEGCKKVCDFTTNCVSFALTDEGDCKLYSNQDFSLPCAGDAESETVYIGESIRHPLCLTIAYSTVARNNMFSSHKLPLLLFPGYNYIFEQPQFTYQRLNNCLDLTGRDSEEKDTLELCQEACSVDDTCYGLQYSSDTQSCTLLSGDLPGFEAVCPSATQTFLQTKSSPYKAMAKTCLRNKIDLTRANNNTPVPIVDTEPYECQALVSHTVATILKKNDKH
jgi:hypothetical protein